MSPEVETTPRWKQPGAGTRPEHAENIFHKLVPGTHPLLDNALSWNKPQARKRSGLEPARGWKTPWLEQALGWNKAFCLAKPCKSHNQCSFKFWMTKSNTSNRCCFKASIPQYCQNCSAPTARVDTTRSFDLEGFALSGLG